MTTTWRDVIDAAVSVGRDPTAWLASVPELAWAEIISRRAPLSAYLGRTKLVDTDNGGSGYAIEPNVVYRNGAERTEQAAFGYRIGMTMAEWACRGLMGLGPTAHAESLDPPGAGPAWLIDSGLPDLTGTHADPPHTWLIEAKGARRLGRGPLVKGARQLSTVDLMLGSHRRVLAGTSLEPRMFVTLDTEEFQPRGGGVLPSVEPEFWDDDNGLLIDGGESLLRLTRSRMLSYLSLVALPSPSRVVLPIGPEMPEFGLRREQTGYVMPLESDASTRAERELATDPQSYRRSPPGGRLDMLIGPVPGTDLVIGMSRRLFAACETLAAQELQLAREIDPGLLPSRSVTQAPLSELEEDELAARIENRRQRYWERERETRSYLAEQTSEAFRRGQDQSWEQLLNADVRISPEPPPGVLEGATRDTYLAVDVRTITSEGV